MQTRTVTLAGLRTKIRRAAKQENSTFFVDAEIDSLINDAIDLYRDTVTEAAGVDWLLSTQTSTGVTSTLTIPVASEIVNVIRTDGGLSQAIPRMPEEARARYQANTTTITVLLEYIATATELALDADPVSLLSAGEELIVNWVAAIMVNAEEGDFTKHEMLWQAAQERLRHMAPRYRTQPRMFVDDRISYRGRRIPWLENAASSFAFRSEGPTTLGIYSLRLL